MPGQASEPARPGWAREHGALGRRRLEPQGGREGVGTDMGMQTAAGGIFHRVTSFSKASPAPGGRAFPEEISVRGAGAQRERLRPESARGRTLYLGLGSEFIRCHSPFRCDAGGVLAQRVIGVDNLSLLAGESPTAPVRERIYRLFTAGRSP